MKLDLILFVHFCISDHSSNILIRLDPGTHYVKYLTYAEFRQHLICDSVNGCLRVRVCGNVCRLMTAVILEY